jgi:hypothetical protein
VRTLNHCATLAQMGTFFACCEGFFRMGCICYREFCGRKRHRHHTSKSAANALPSNASALSPNPAALFFINPQLSPPNGILKNPDGSSTSVTIPSAVFCGSSACVPCIDNRACITKSAVVLLYASGNSAACTFAGSKKEVRIPPGSAIRTRIPKSESSFTRASESPEGKRVSD